LRLRLGSLRGLLRLLRLLSRRLRLRLRLHGLRALHGEVLSADGLQLQPVAEGRRRDGAAENVRGQEGG
jgi:hypothetical protein